jgi:tRNA (guanine6-N2)-methyltransferase
MGLKPWAESSSPCGAKTSQNPPYLSAIPDRGAKARLSVKANWRRKTGPWIDHSSRSMKMSYYWLRTIRGLEWLAAAEVAGVADPLQMTFGHRDVFVDCDYADAGSLRCPDDIFSFWALLCNLDRTRETLRRLSKAAEELPQHPGSVSEFRRIHVTASFLGQRNYSRSEIEHAFGMSLAGELGLQWCANIPDEPGTLRVRIHLVGERAAIGIALTPLPIHRRPWRVHTQRGMLHPPIAAAMALLAGLHEGLTIFDPYAGSGTILIEAGLLCPNIRLFGWDIDPQAVAIAGDHAARAGIAAIFQSGDALRALQDLPRPDRVLSNPPWGRSLTTTGPSNADPLEVLLNLLSAQTRLVVVGDRSMKMAEFWKRKGYQPEIIFPIRVSGRIADIAVVSATPTNIWRELGQYWKAMENIPWEGEDSEATLNVPSAWGSRIRLP